MLSGEKNIQYLLRHGISKWSDLADDNGDLGPFYGSLWRSWETKDGNTVDQISNAIEQIKNSPDSRRILINAWNLGELEKMKLPPCHFAFQFHITDEKLSCMVFMRSFDVYNVWTI
jgi:thymidylate synthase